MNLPRLIPHLQPLVRRSLVLFVLACVCTGVAVATDVYKYKDPRGQTVYADQRPQGSAQILRLKNMKKPTADERARTEARLRAFEQSANEHLEHEKVRVEQEVAARAERDKRCAAARAENARFGYGGRMCQVDGQGNRLYYSAAEMDRRRASAAQEIAVSCPKPASK